MEGRSVGRYQLLRRLAAGGMGEIYLAAQGGPAGFERVVALKRMLPTVASERELIKSFLDEARLVARLSHRNICQIYELGEDGDGYFVAMELVQGTSVRGLIDRLAELGQRIPPAMAVDIAAQVAEALGYAWEAPGRDGRPLHIIHRDVTPHNVLLSISGDVKLIDFGVAKSADQSHATETGTIKGKLAYMSPEQSRGQPLDGRSDLFSLGVLLYEMLTGKNPFARPDIVQTIMALQNDVAPSLASVEPSLAGIDRVLSRLLVRDPAARFPDANQAYEELAQIKAALPRPPKRLGPFISEHFSGEISALVKSVSDSDARRALKEAPAPRDTSDPASQVVEPTAVQDATEGIGDAATELRSSTAQLRPTLELEAPRGPGRGLAIAAVALAVAAAAGAVVWQLWPSSRGVEPVAVVEPPIPAKKVEPPPAAPEPPDAAEKVAEPAGPDASEKLAEPVVPPKPADPVVAKVVKKPKPGKKEPEVAPEAHPELRPAKLTEPEGPLPQPAPAPTPVATVTVSGAFGRSKVTLAGEGGHVALAKMGELAVGLDWSASGGAVSARLTSEPWAILAIDGVSKGKTPIALPALGKAALPLELRRLGGESVQFVISAEPAH